jgi:hypothetical protein
LIFFLKLINSKANCKEGFNIEHIAKEYANWVKSPPFDMGKGLIFKQKVNKLGITIGASIGCVMKGEHNSVFKQHLEKVGIANGNSIFSLLIYKSNEIGG